MEPNDATQRTEAPLTHPERVRRSARHLVGDAARLGLD